MYPVTDAVKALYAAEQRQFLRITGTDKNGTAINITDANVVLGSFNIDRYSCNGNRIEVGTAIAAEMTVKLDNHEGTYNGIVFEGTELYVEIGIGDPVQWMPCGYFTPDEQPRTANQITIHALDRMVKFDNSVPGLLPWTTETGEIVTNEADQPIYFMTDLAYPATIQSIIQTVCGYYYIPFTQDISSFPNYNYTISEAPNLQQPTTFRNIIQWCAGIMGTCAWIDWTGSLRFSWYGATTGYVSTPANRFSSDLHEDDVEITGVQYTNLENYTVLAGRPEYTIDMTGNYLMAGNVTQILTTVNNAINGFTYRPFSATIINAPYLWPMDQITFTDKDGNDHTCILTNVNFGINGTMSVEGKGESMQAASRDALSGMTKEQGVLVEQAREATQKLDDSLTQEEIFNRLTGNGAEQGLILYNGKLYLNASYISAGTVSADILKGGVLKLGGENNVNGVMQVYKANGDMVFQLNDNGAVMSGGSIQLSSNLGTENAVVKLQEELNEPLLIEYHGINIDAKTRLLGNGIEITNNNTGLQLYITSSGMSFSTNDTAWLIVNYYDGSPGLSIYGDLYVSNGASGSFTTADGKTVIVSGGIITSIA
jgi:hypothetical protein